MTATKKKAKRKAKSTTKTVVLEVETTATVADLRESMPWEDAVCRMDPKARVRQVTVQVADRTK